MSQLIANRNLLTQMFSELRDESPQIFKIFSQTLNDFLNNSKQMNLNMNWAYMISQQKTLFFSVTNINGFKNVNDYPYPNAPNMVDLFNRLTKRPTTDAFFVVGFFFDK